MILLRLLTARFLTRLLPPSSQVPHDRRPPHEHGHDGLLPHDDPAPGVAAAEHAQIRPRRQEAGAVLGAEEGWEMKSLDCHSRLIVGPRPYMALPENPTPPWVSRGWTLKNSLEKKEAKTPRRREMESANASSVPCLWPLNAGRLAGL